MQQYPIYWLKNQIVNKNPFLMSQIIICFTYIEEKKHGFCYIVESFNSGQKRKGIFIKNVKRKEE